jgi:hypothetical protein
MTKNKSVSLRQAQTDTFVLFKMLVNLKLM